MKNLYVIDASGYLYRSYFAIRGMTNERGESTNALFGFIRSILKLFKDFKPDHIVSVFDGPHGGKAREAIYPEYKAHREAMPPDLRYQMAWAREFCDLMGIPQLSIPEVEADDTMGTIAKWASEHEMHVYLCTSDKDMAQLVNEQVSILNTHKENLILDGKGVEEAYGVPPHQMIDFLAITGDSSDNVPGLSGFGPKTAVSLLQEFQSLDAILSHPEKVPGKKKQETIIAEKDQALLSRKLVTINTEVAIPSEPSFYTLKSPKILELRHFYTDKSFNSLLKELDVIAPKKVEDLKYHVVDDEQSFKNLLELLSKQKEICFELVTTDERPLLADIVGIGFGFKSEEAWYIPFNGTIGASHILEGIKPLFANSNIGFYSHDVKHDLHVLRKYDISIANIAFDTLVASYLLNADKRRHELETLALEHFGKVVTPTSDLTGKGKNAIAIEQVECPKICQYCCEQVDYTVRLKELFQEQLKERAMETLFYQLEMPLLRVISEMEYHGIYLDVPVMQQMGTTVVAEINHLAHDIYAMAGEEFNLNSPKQLGEILFTKLGIRNPKRTKVSTSADILEELQDLHPIAGLILEYRTLEKLRSTYIDTLPTEVHPKSQRIHPTFNQSATATGRISCQDPNLQNIPVRTEVGRQIRTAFRPEKSGWSYIAADYSQIELRLLAHFSEDPTLIDAFSKGEDIHAHTAATVLGIPISEVTKDQRFHAKAVNFGLMYGQGAYGLARELGISPHDASVFIEKYFQRYEKVKIFLEKCKDLARLNGKAVTALGRERLIPEILSKNGQIRSQAERLAVNTPLQGTAADLIKMAMLEIDKQLKKHNFKGYLILQVHDELIFEVPDEEIELIKPIIRDSMQNAMKLNVPLVVDINIGKNWKEC